MTSIIAFLTQLHMMTYVFGIASGLALAYLIKKYIFMWRFYQQYQPLVAKVKGDEEGFVDSFQQEQLKLKQTVSQLQHLAQGMADVPSFVELRGGNITSENQSIASNEKDVSDDLSLYDSNLQKLAEKSQQQFHTRGLKATRGVDVSSLATKKQALKARLENNGLIEQSVLEHNRQEKALSRMSLDEVKHKLETGESIDNVALSALPKVQLDIMQSVNGHSNAR